MVPIQPVVMYFSFCFGPSAYQQMNNLGLVVEDAPSGLTAGRAAGAKTLAVCTSHSKELIKGTGVHFDYIVQDLSQ